MHREVVASPTDFDRPCSNWRTVISAYECGNCFVLRYSSLGCTILDPDLAEVAPCGAVGALGPPEGDLPIEEGAMEGRTPPRRGLRDSAIRTVGRGLRAAYGGVSRWATSPTGKVVVKVACEGVKLYARCKGIDFDFPEVR
jgi:hypothetical protein